MTPLRLPRRMPNCSSSLVRFFILSGVNDRPRCTDLVDMM
jgi:hypothetical protein